MIAQIKQIGDYQYDGRFLLGEGAFGRVYKGQKKGSSEAVAIKKIDLIAFEKDQYMKQSLQNEIAILKKFDSPYIVRFLDMIQDKSTIFIMTEFCQDGDLRDYIRKKKITENEVIQIGYQIVQGFKVLQKHGVIHRDLKPANILSHNGIIKIADFGFARHVDDYTTQLMRSCVGSPLYMAPQVLSKKSYTSKCDVWSFGVVFYEMLFHSVPWTGRSEADLLNNVRDKPLAIKQCSRFCEELLRAMLQYDENNRVSWERVFEMYDAQIQPAPPPRYSFIVSDEQETEINSNQLLNQYKFNNQTTEQIKRIKDLRNEVQFRHFVNIELFAKQQFCKFYVKRELSYEKFYGLLSKIILAQMKGLIQQANLLADNIPFKEQLIAMMTKEHTYAQTLYQDTKEYLEMLGVLPNMLSDDNFKLMYENLFANPFAPVFEKELEKSGIHLVRECLNDFNRQQQNTDRAIEFLSIMDYILDIFLIHKRYKRQEEIDFNAIHNENMDMKDTLKYREILMYKLRQVESL